MTDSPTHLALREWRAHLTSPPALAALVGLAVVLSAMGAYDTDRVLRPVPRFAYWLTIAIGTYAAGAFIHLASVRLPTRSRALRVALAAIVTAIAAFLIVTLVNGSVFGHWPGRDDLLPLFLNVFVISAVVSLVLEIIDAHQETAAPDTATRPALLDRLPLDKRGPLLSLSVEDHYVRVRTTRGEEMVLMRLGDAIRETAPTDGLQVHRSHWVARAAVTAARRDGDRAILTLTDGHELPASRRYIPALRDAGLLPR